MSRGDPKTFPKSRKIVCAPSVFTYPPLTLIQSTIAALTLEMTYGFNIESHEDKLLQATQRASAHAEKAFIPGAFLVNVLPIRGSQRFVFLRLPI